MKRSEILDLLREGKFIKKSSAMKFKHGKLVRGTHYDYTIDDMKITQKQFESIEYRLRKEYSGDLSTKIYSFNM